MRKFRRELFARETESSITFGRGKCASQSAQPGAGERDRAKRRIVGQEEIQCIFVSFVPCCSHSSCFPCRQHRSRKLAWPLGSARPRCPSMSSLFVPATVIFGPLATGPTITTSTITTGCQELG